MGDRPPRRAGGRRPRPRPRPRGAGLRAHARVAAGAPGRPGGRTRWTTLRSDPPLTFRPTGDGVLHLVGTAAGPLGGDDLRLDVEVGAGAAVIVRSVAAALAQPSPHGTASRLVTSVAVAAGAALDWAPEPTVLVRGCDHRTDTTIRLAAGATLVWREVVVLGRHAEAPGSLRQRLVVDVVDEGGTARPLLRNELAVGPAWPGSLGPAGVGDARAVATVVVVGPDALVQASGPDAHALDPPAGVRAAGLPLTEQACVYTALGPDPASVLKALPDPGRGPGLDLGEGAYSASRR